MWKEYSKHSQPRPGQMILVVGRDRSTNPKPLEYFRRFRSVAQYKGSGDFAIKEPVFPWETEVTHWMPLPKYPEDTLAFKVKAFLNKLMFWKKNG